LAGWRAATRDPDITEAVETGPATNCRRSYHRSQPIAAPGGGSGRGAPQSSAWGSSPIDLAAERLSHPHGAPRRSIWPSRSICRSEPRRSTSQL
jgi:hypothetical protein